MTNKPLRRLYDVIDQMLPLIPKDKKSLRIALLSIKDSALFAPPENQAIWWKQTAVVLAEQIGQPKEGWHHQIANIMRGTA